MSQPEFHREVHEFFHGGIRFLFLPAAAAQNISDGNGINDVIDANEVSDVNDALDSGRLEDALSLENRQILKAISNPARRQEFLRTRFLVRLAAGLASDPGRDADGLIQWPRGFCGSVSHSLGDVVVATSTRAMFASIGIDIERPSRISDKLAEKICTDSERQLICNGVVSLAEIFSAKEALFKCHYPLGRRRFWFLDAEIVAVNIESGTKKLDVRVLIDTTPLTPANTVTRVDVLPPVFGEFVLSLALLPA